MRRLRIVFVLLGLLLLLPLAVLLARAWQGLERERDARHELVASRVFDESERALGELLREEQARPVEGYLIDVDSLRRPDYVIGYFEIDRDGSVATRAHDAAALVARVRGAFERFPPMEQPFVDELAKRKAPEKPRAKVAQLNVEQEPGTTRLLQKVVPLKGTEKLADKDLQAGEKEESSSDSYNRMVESLNLGKRASADARESSSSGLSSFSTSRSRSAASAPEAPSASAPAHAPAVAPDSVAEASGPAGASRSEPPPLSERKLELDVEKRDRVLAEEGSPPAADEVPERRRERESAGGAALGRLAARSDAPAPAAKPLRTSLEGRLAGEGQLVLHRTVIRGGRAYEQGLLVDLEALGAKLETDVLGGSGLRPYLELDFSLAGAPSAPLASDRFVYAHRFQEPFDALSAQLSVAPLPEESSASYLYALGALLALASTAGLWAVYRRVAAAVHFSERRSNFAAAVSHELKTPLTAIRMYAEMLRDGMVADEATRKSYLDTITSESERLTRLINNVLEFSRLERRTHELVLVSETPLPALRAALRTLEPHTRAQGFSLRETSAEPLPAAVFDRDALQQILFNLIDNALKYARRAERKEIEVASAACPGGVVVRVRDFGPGVSREHEPHLFEPFFRGGDELTRQTQGTGIGLALVRELAQRMGAEVRAQNCADGGFAVELRLRGA